METHTTNKHILYSAKKTTTFPGPSQWTSDTSGLITHLPEPLYLLAVAGVVPVDGVLLPLIHI